MPDFNTCYSGAWQEISARIQARENVLLSYLAFTAILIGFSLSDDKYLYLGVFVGYLTLATSLLIIHHDYIIGVLNAYQMDLSIKDTKNQSVPSWHEKDYMGKALTGRTIRDISQTIFMSIGSFIGVYVSYKTLSFLEDCEYKSFLVLWVGSILAIIASVVSIIINAKKRNKHYKSI